MKRPITQSPEAGHCARTNAPRIMVMIPSTACQPQPGRVTMSEPISSNNPPIRKNMAMTKVKASAVISGRITSSRPVTPKRIGGQQMVEEARPMPNHDRLDDFDRRRNQQQPAEEQHRGD